eukprot:SAG25_NODE_2204_length_1840_cov_1.533601_2_plen_101_part_00
MPVGGAPLESAYRLVLGGAECAWTTWKRRGASETRHTIDYLFVSAELGVERVLLPPRTSEVAAERLPGWRYPSDHIALFAQLRVPVAAAAAAAAEGSGSL